MTYHRIKTNEWKKYHLRNISWCESWGRGGGGKKISWFSFVHFVWLLVCVFLVFNFHFWGFLFESSTYKVVGEAFQFQINQADNWHLRWHRCRLFCYHYLGRRSVHFDFFFYWITKSVFVGLFQAFKKC